MKWSVQISLRLIIMITKHFSPRKKRVLENIPTVMIYVGWLTARVCATLYCVDVRMYKWRDVIIWKQFSMKVRWRICCLHISRGTQHTSKQAKYYDAYSMADFADKSILSMAHLNICFHHERHILDDLGILITLTRNRSLKHTANAHLFQNRLFCSDNTVCFGKYYVCMHIYLFFSSSLGLCVFFLFLPVCRVWTLSPTSCVLMLFINLYLLLLLLSPFYHTHLQRYLWKHMQIRTHIHQHPN